MCLLMKVQIMSLCSWKCHNIEDRRQYATVNATVLELCEPFAMSCSMVVQIDDLQSSGLSGRYILKVYDRRFAMKLRQHVWDVSWNSDIENEYRIFLQSDAASPFFSHCYNTPFHDLVLDRYHWDKQEREAYLQFICRKFYDTETRVYDRLHDIQGIDVPHLFGRFSINFLSNGPEPEGEYLDCPAILLEVIHGFTLEDIAENAPREVWQEVCDEAIRIVNDIGDHGIRNEDVQPRNFIVHKDERTGRFRPIMIDFARCVLRSEGEDDNVWGYWKATQDEEGAIGRVMGKKLGDGFRYQRTEESDRLQDKFMDEYAERQWRKVLFGESSDED